MKTAKDDNKNPLLLHTSIILMLIVLVTITISCSDVFGETTVISATDGATSILIANEGGLNFIKFQDDNGLSVHFDSKLKHYKSGGFSMKNFESGIVVFGHKISMSQYKLVIITSENVSRLIGFIDVIRDIESQKEITKPEIVESGKNIAGKLNPEKEIDSNVSKWDVPIPKSRTEKPSSLLTVSSDPMQTIKLSSELDKVFKIWNARNSDKIEGAIVKMEISRDGIILKSLEKISGIGGMVRFETSGLTYPVFYPNFCYDVKVTATFENQSFTWTDDFKITYSGVWNPNTNWMGDSRYNHLGEEFREEPRKTTRADENCN